jgi:lipoprotein-releasing system ATP-binding protein
LGGLDAPTAGRVVLNGTPLEQLKKSAKNTTLNQIFGFVFQFHYLIRELSAIENVMIPGLIKGIRRATCQTQAGNLLATVGLSGKEHAYPSQLSGGEQQRVAIARAMFNKPAFLFADEPTGNLDTENAQTIVDLFLKGQQEWNMGIILCSHDPAIYTKMQTIYHLEHGILAQKNS